jgi:uncharacterized protein YodC (DUF2158 family)
MSDNTEFSVGTIVRLLSGGPAMTIFQVSRNEGGAPKYKVGWFDRDWHYNYATFIDAELELAHPNRDAYRTENNER